MLPDLRRPAASVRHIVEILSSAKVVDLAQPLENGMPCSPNHPGFRMVLMDRHEVASNAKISGANELIITGGHVGTHIDALCHLAVDGKMYGGADAREACAGGKSTVHGIDTVHPFICRGLFADVAAAKDVDHLAPGYGITREDLSEALKSVEVSRGDVVVIRTGWPQRYSDNVSYLGLESGVPGLTEEAATYLGDLGVVAVGTDTIATDQIIAGKGHGDVPAHRVLLAERGVHIIEVMNLEQLSMLGASEFLFVAIPLKIVGGTGSPIRPLALITSTNR